MGIQLVDTRDKEDGSHKFHAYGLVRTTTGGNVDQWYLNKHEHLQEENPDSVFYSEDGCLAGGGRGSGCCPGAQWRVCEPNGVGSTSGRQMRWNSCLCEPCPAGSVQYRAGMNTCVECPAGW